MMKASGWPGDRVITLSGAEESPRCTGQGGGQHPPRVTVGQGHRNIPLPKGSKGETVV